MAKMKQALVDVTPQQAAIWLKQNVDHNRALREADVIRYAEEMTDDRWILSPEGIVFDTDERLIDGQHRLSAVVLSGKTVQMVVWTNVPPEVLRVLDTGRSRSLTDVLTVTQSVGADVPARNIVPRAGIIYGLHFPDRRNERFGPIQYEWIKDRYIDNLAWSSRVYSNSGPGVKSGTVAAKVRSASVMGALCVAHRKAKEEIEVFTRKLDKGLELTETDPAYALRRHLDGANMGGHNRYEFAYATFRAAYAAIHRRKLSVLKTSLLTRENPEFAEMLRYFGVMQ